MHEVSVEWCILKCSLLGVLYGLARSENTLWAHSIRPFVFPCFLIVFLVTLLFGSKLFPIHYSFVFSSYHLTLFHLLADSVLK